MSGPLGSQQWMYASGGFYPYSIDQSLRFNDNDSAYLNRTFASAGNQQIWTWSGWVKRGNLASGSAGRNTIFSGSGTQIFGFMNPTTNATADNFGCYLTDSEDDRFMTNRVFRDVNSWYHLVVTFNSTASSNDDRFRLWVNGVQETSWSRFDTITQNRTTGINAAAVHAIGVQANASSQFFDGYMAEVNFIDGTALDPTSFGETINGIWVPKQYSGSYGTNGFYLSFADSAAIGDDLSGNTNDWTANNLAAHDVVPDSPTNNFATINVLDSHGASTYTEGNLNFADGGGDGATCLSTFVIPDIADTTTYYIELLHYQGYAFGIAPETYSAAHTITSRTGILSWYSNGNLYDGSSIHTSSWSTASTTGEIRSMVVGNGQVEYFRNGTSLGVAFTGLTGAWKIAEWAVGAAGTGVTFNFGQDDTFAGAVTSGSAGSTDANGYGKFYYSEASSHTALCSANLPEPAIGPNSDTTSDQHFNTVLYTGTGATQSITGVAHAPDFVWIKNRSVIQHHNLFDTVRGAGKLLYSSLTNAEATTSIHLNSFDSDGFTVGSATSANGTGNSIVSWNWKAGGKANTFNIDGTGYASIAASPISDGSIALTGLSANTTSGFSIVGYTGTGSNGTIAHGLTSAPEMFICRNRTNARDWLVYHKDIDYTKDIFLNLTNAQRGNDVYQQQAPDDSLIYLETQDRINESGSNHIMWCFHSVPGYSSVGKYIGNLSTDGPFIYTGFRPAFVMTKRTDSTSSWYINDTKRSPDNDTTGEDLYPNLSNEEGGTVPIDILSNGFKLRVASNSRNASGGTYIYLAFAEAPFKYANAR